MTECVQQELVSVNACAQKMRPLPEWLREVSWGRLDNWHVGKERRPTRTEQRAAADFVRGLQTDTPEKVTVRRLAAKGGDTNDAKGEVPFWSIAGKWATEDAPRTEFVQLDFDKFQATDAADLDEKIELAKTIIMKTGAACIIARSVSGRGVFAIVRTLLEPAQAKEKILDPLSRILTLAGVEHTNDYKVTEKGAGQGRVESFDPCPYIAQELVYADHVALMQRAAEAEARATADAYAEANAGFYTHPISRIVRCIRKDPKVGGIATAGALAFVGSATNVYSRSRAGDYPARAFIVAIGEAGSGKTTTLDALADARWMTGTDCIIDKPKSDAMLSMLLTDSGTRWTTYTDDMGKTKKKRVLIDEAESPKNTLLYLDEGGKFLKSVAKNDKCGDMDSAFCLAFNDRFTPPKTVGNYDIYADLRRIQINATLFICATPKQWIEYAATEEEENGMIRRRLVFYDEEAKTEAPEGVSLLDLTPPEPVDAETLRGYCRDLQAIPPKTRFVVTDEALGATADAIAALRSAGIKSEAAWRTLIINYATLCAAARCALTSCERYEVTAEDMAAVTCILRESLCKSRAKIAEGVEAESLKKHKSEEEVWCEIRERLTEGARKDKLRAWLDRRPHIYRDTYAKMLSRGDVVEERSDYANRALRVRLATADERAEIEARRAEVRSVFDGTARAGTGTGNRTEYAEASPAEKETRLEKYFNEFLAAHSIAEGSRNNTLSALVTQLQNAGMYDETAQQRVTRLCQAYDLKADEIRKIVRYRPESTRRGKRA